MKFVVAGLQVLGVLALAGCSTVMHRDRAPSGDPRPDATIHILSTTDLHGYLLAQKNKAGLMEGGVDYTSAYFKIARAKDPQTLLLDSGDLFQGTPISNDFEGASVIQFYNYSGYTAAAIGNHDFDYGPVGPDSVAIHPGEDPLGALKANEASAQFPFLSANICSVSEDPGKCTDVTQFKNASISKPYVINTVNGVQVGIIGLTTVDTPTVTMPANVSALRFMPGSDVLERFVPEMKAKGADMIVVIAHIGGFCKAGVCNPQDELFQLIDKLTPATRQAIPLILAGHTHNYANMTYNGVRVMITGCYGQSFGYETLNFHGADGSVTVDGHQSVDVCQQVYPDTKSCSKGTGTPVAATFLGQTVTPDAAAVQLISSEIAATQAESAQIVGSLKTPLNKGGLESTMGDFMTDAMRFCYVDSTCQAKADVAIINNGGIRSSIPEAGPVNYGQVFNVMPFDNLVATAMISGAQLHALLDAFYKTGGMQQISGMTITFDSTSTKTRDFTNEAGVTQTLPDPIVSMTMSDGSALDESKTYTLVLPDFLATGGSGAGFVMTALKNPAVINYNRKVRDVMVDDFKANPSGLDYSVQTPRLVDVGAAAPAAASRLSR